MNIRSYIQERKDMTHTPIPNRCEENIIHEALVRTAQANLIDELAATRLAQTYQALADPTRIRLISALMSGQLCVCDLAATLGMTQSAVSHQLGGLRVKGLVRARKQGRIVYYTISDDHIRDLFQRGLEHIQHT